MADTPSSMRFTLGMLNLSNFSVFYDFIIVSCFPSLTFRLDVVLAYAASDA